MSPHWNVERRFVCIRLFGLLPACLDVIDRPRPVPHEMIDASALKTREVAHAHMNAGMIGIDHVDRDQMLLTQLPHWLFECLELDRAQPGSIVDLRISPLLAEALLLQARMAVGGIRRWLC